MKEEERKKGNLLPWKEKKREIWRKEFKMIKWKKKWIDKALIKLDIAVIFQFFVYGLNARSWTNFKHLEHQLF